MKKNTIKSLPHFRQWFVLMLSLLLLVAYGADPISDRLILNSDAAKYQYAEYSETELVSRKWMNYAMELQKNHNFAPTNAARLYAYVASIYSDALEYSKSSSQASLAVYALLNVLIPEDRSKHSEMFTAIVGRPISSDDVIENVIKKYTERIRSDNSTLIWDKSIPNGNSYWYIRGDKTDTGAMAGKWKTWIVPEKINFNVPPPPKNGSIQDKLELKKVLYATAHRTPEQQKIVQFWHGTTAYVKGAKKDNITPAGVWQNIYYVEKHSGLTDSEYAKMQKILAQSIADAFIFCWRVKYAYFSMRPSMRLSSIRLSVADPPFPGYVSGHATVSETAAVVLSSFYPAESSKWEDMSKSARNSRLIGGIHFDTDNQEGAILGRKIGAEIVRQLLGKKIPNVKFDKYKTMPFFALLHLYMRNLLDEYAYIPRKIVNYALSNKNKFREVSGQVGLFIPNAQYAAWYDMDLNGSLDLIANNSIFYNNNNVFKGKPWNIHEGNVTDVNSIAIADYNNDGCPDIYLVRNDNSETMPLPDHLLKNECDGTFSDVSAQAGIFDADSGMAASWADYNNDGYLDIYVTNWHDVDQDFSTNIQKNILYKNNADGTFTNVTETAGVTGLPDCPNYPSNQYENSLFKNSYQPIWFDYNNDGLQDLYVATDTWLSPLYKNNGDGTFKDTTYESGLCVLGTGMGVSVSDYDNDGYFDLYVTNTGSNYVWHNKGDGTFEEIAKQIGVANEGQGWGTGWLDFDNDMDDDLFVVNGTDAETLTNSTNIDIRNLDELYENIGNNKYIPVGESAGIKGNLIKRSAAFGDYNNDGYMDIYVTNLEPREGVYNSLYENAGRNLHSLRLKLVGTKSNKDAIGATVTITIGTWVKKIPVLNGTSFYSQYSMPLVIGVGKHTIVDSVEIHWPSGINQLIKKVRTDILTTVSESTHP